MKIGFIGVGKLGKEAAEVMAEKHDIVGYDVNNVEPENFKMVASIEEACKGREIIFIAVPTAWRALNIYLLGLAPKNSNWSQWMNLFTCVLILITFLTLVNYDIINK